jgi:hypothetical protein
MPVHGELYWIRIGPSAPTGGLEDGVVWVDTSTTPATIRRYTAGASWESVAGGPGGSADLAYLHVQGTPSTSWAINHMLGKFPSITVVDGTGNEIEADISHTDDDHAVATFATAVSGSAFVN